MEPMTMMALATAASAGLGMLDRNRQQKKQLEQQKKLQALQIEGQ